MDLQEGIDLLAIRSNTLLDNRGKVIATVSHNLEPARLSAYIHLFSTAPELLRFLETKLSSALEMINEQMKPTPTLTGHRAYTSGRAYPDPPSWVEEMMEVVALAYGEKSNIEEENQELSIAETEGNALQDSDGEIIIRLSPTLSAQSSDRFIHLFLAAPLLLQIVDTTAKEELAEIRREYESGKAFDPLGADESHFIIPDRLRALCDLVAKAKGAAPVSAGAAAK
jgi:hypothetical protein